jgi:hypothetical protein
LEIRLHSLPESELEVLPWGTLMATTLSGPESEADSEWFPKLQLISCALSSGILYYAASSVSTWNYPLGAGLMIVLLVLSIFASFVGQFLVVPIAIFMLRRHPSLQGVENFAVLVGCEVAYLYLLAPLLGSLLL